MINFEGIRLMNEERMLCDIWYISVFVNETRLPFTEVKQQGVKWSILLKGKKV